MEEPYIFAQTNGANDAPLVFTFHGTGGTEAQFHALGSELISGAHVISPRGDVSEMGAARYFKRTGEGIYDMDDLAARTAKMIGFVEDHKDRLGAQKLIGLGYSNGANILASVSLVRPDLFDVMILMHPLIPWAPDRTLRFEGKKILITAGENDPICPKPLTDQLVAYYENQGATLSQFWHAGGHQITPEEFDAIKDFLS